MPHAADTATQSEQLPGIHMSHSLYPARYNPPQQPYKQPESSYACYNKSGCLQSTASPCGPAICYTCPSPNLRRFWNWDEAKHRQSEVDPVRHNIYYGGVICSFEPRDKINRMMCDRLFLNSPARAPYEYVHNTDVEFYLRNGESSSCSKFWEYRYNEAPHHNMGDPGHYQRIGPAPLER
jgi:hypothetical protein